MTDRPVMGAAELIPSLQQRDKRLLDSRRQKYSRERKETKVSTNAVQDMAVRTLGSSGVGRRC